MITTYNNFLVEGKNKWKQSDPEYYGITNYEWVNGKLICLQNVIISNQKWKTIPFDFGKVDGNFYCNSNINLINLIGSPEEINGVFMCNQNERMVSLEGCTEKVERFYCQYNDSLKSFNNCPKFVEHDFFCSDNTSIEGFIENYPMSIIEGKIISGYDVLQDICNLVKENREKFEPLLGNRVAFNQMVMRLNPSLIKYYKITPHPSRNTIL